MQIPFYDTRISDEGTTILVKEKSMYYETAVLNSPEGFSKMIQTLIPIDKLAEEHCYMAAMNCKCHIIGLFFLSKGTVNTSQLSPREILIRALLVGASQIVVFHNHPSGDATPSKEDIAATKRIQDACKLIRIYLTDHIIIGRSNYFSFLEAGAL